MSVANFDAQNEILWQAWQDLQAQAEAALKKGAAHYFTCIRQSACGALALEALASAKLGQSDERVFNHLVRLMETYREVIGLFESPIKDTSPDLVEGLCDILGSRLRQFEDDSTGLSNPVAREKYAILEKAIVNTARQIEDLEKSYLYEFQWPIKANCACEPGECEPQPELTPSCDIDLCKELALGNTATVWQSLRESIIEKNLPALHASYIKNLQICLSNLDDLHARKTAGYYTDLLEREWEVLGLIIQVQVRAIETAFEAALETASEAANPENTSGYSLHAILSKLREAYQQTGPIVSGLRKMMQTAVSSHPAPGSGHEEFADAMVAGLVVPPTIGIDNQAFVAALLPNADEMFESLRTGHIEETNNLRLAVTNEISLTEEIVSAFEKVSAGLISLQEEDICATAEPEPATTIEAPGPDTTPEDADKPQEPTLPSANNQEKEILAGIAETIEIKIESLAESLQLFSENSAQMLASISTGLPVLSEEILTSAASQLMAAWCVSPPSLDETEDFLTGCISLGAFATYSEQLTKHISNLHAKIEKASFRFKKETLLYEISTYEEILYHSVSRLRESPLPQVGEAVNLLDETFSTLEILLTESGITVIRPQAHELFNGREHEVLMAEEAEGFAKGEIIKVMTSGYKFKDQVILRANVIAAR